MSEFEVPDTPEGIDAISDAATPNLEPSASWRATAVMTRQYYIALTDAGFSEEQAERMVTAVLVVGARHSLGDTDT